MSNWEKHPLKIGDCVMDDNAETGVVFSLSSITLDKDGNVEDWEAYIRYDYDQPSYGKTKRVGPRQVSKILADGSEIDL